MHNARLVESQAGIKIAKRNINNLRYADDTVLMAENEEGVTTGNSGCPCVGPGKSNLPFELRRKAGDCSRVTAGPIDLI